MATPSAAASGRSPAGLAAAALPEEHPHPAAAFAATSLTTTKAGWMGRAVNPAGVLGPSAWTTEGGNVSDDGGGDRCDGKVGSGRRDGGGVGDESDARPAGDATPSA